MNLEEHALAALPWQTMPPGLVAQVQDTVMQLVQAAMERARAAAVAHPTAAAALPTGPVADRRLARLSAREREVLARIAAGDSNKLIARALDLSPHTVKRHVANILDKLDLCTRAQAAALWHRQGALSA